MTPFQLLPHYNCSLKMGSLVIHLCAGGQSPCADSNKLWRSIMCEEKQSCLAAAHRPCSSPPFLWKLKKNVIASPGSLNNCWSLSKSVGYWCSNLPSVLTYRVWCFNFVDWRKGKVCRSLNLILKVVDPSIPYSTIIYRHNRYQELFIYLFCR